MELHVRIAVVLLLVQVAVSQKPEVCFNSGCVRGVRMPGMQAEEFDAFFGIPYALPPIGALRFANPIPAKNWTQVLDASKPKDECLQKNFLLPNTPLTGSEDCLYLNVYRQKDIKKGTLLPVMVYIHGGGFFSGSPSPALHGPEYFMDKKGVILVMMAYRLGPLGFMSTNDSSAPGNFGFKDQLLALKWVQANIKHFGGDNHQITIFGQSAGGCSVHMHILSEASNGLFHRAISMSGFANAAFNEPTKDPLALAIRQAEVVGIKNASNLSTKELVELLRKVNASALVDSGDKLRYWNVDPLTLYRTVVEPEGDGAFMTADPLSIMESGLYEKVPWMTGVVPVEGAVRAAAIVARQNLLKDFNKHIDELLPQLMELDFHTEDEKETILHELKDKYLNGSNEIDDSNDKRFIQMFSDRAFLSPLQKAVQLYIDNGLPTDPDLYIYKFNYRGNFSYAPVFTGNNNNYGVVHCDDLLYLFRTPLIFPDFAKGSKDEEMVKLMVSTYISFAYGRDPNHLKNLIKCTGPIQDEFCTYNEITLENDSPVIRASNQTIINQDTLKLWNSLISMSNGQHHSVDAIR